MKVPAAIEEMGKESMKSTAFEPKILAFCCHYCAYSSADLAGSMRIQYPPNVRIIRTPCTGRLEAQYFVKAIENGADGVLIAGCLEGGCHFIEGNLCAKRRVNYVRELLAEIGLDKERLRMVNVSAAMARPLADIIVDMTETIRKLGPNPLGAGRMGRFSPWGTPYGAAHAVACVMQHGQQVAHPTKLETIS